MQVATHTAGEQQREAGMSARRCFMAIIWLLLGFAPAHQALATLTVSPLSWDIVGLDSNTPGTGPNHFPVGVQVCSDVNTTNVSVNFLWDPATATSYIYLTPGGSSSFTIDSITAGTCKPAYFEVEINPIAASFDKSRLYHITATDVSGTVSSPTPRQIYVEYLISQNRNGVLQLGLSTDGVTYSYSLGGTWNLQLGNTYYMQVPRVHQLVT